MAEMTDCAFCGREAATGRAFIGDLRYCHGDEDDSPTCYEQGQWDISHGFLDGPISPTAYWVPTG